MKAKKMQNIERRRLRAANLFAGVPDFIHAAFGSHPALEGLMLSQPTDPYDRSLLPTIVPERDRLRAVLPGVIDRAFGLGIEVGGLDGPCGPPLCAFGADRRVTALTPIPEQIAGRTYLAACAAYAVRGSCFGVRVADVELYGDRCARPLATPPPAPPTSSLARSEPVSTNERQT